METRVAARRADIIKRLFPLLYEDEYYFAVAKPPRTDLELTIRPKGATYAELIAEIVLGESPDDAEPPIPLILPERFASGVALFARSEEAARRLAGMSETGKLRFVHSAVVKGKPPRSKIAVKPGRGKGKTGTPPGGRPTVSPPAAKLEILASQTDRHLARCVTAAARFEDIRRSYKAGGMTIVGDERVFPQNEPRAARPARQPLLHFEELRFPHPFTRKAVHIHAPTPRGLMGHVTKTPPPEEHLLVALARRVSCLIDEKTDAFRLFAGRDEGISGLAVELLGEVVTIETLQGKFHEGDMQLQRIANFYERMLGVSNVVAQRIPKHRDKPTGSGSAADSVEVLKGAAPDEAVITENGLKFIVKPAQCSAAGLFLDQRDNRRRINGLARGKEVLNLFAYTCGFSVAASAGEAASTTSVDLAARHLDWGRQNFAVNGIELDHHTFIKDDAFEYVKRAKRQGKSFDVIILDPPSFSRSKKPKRTFELKKNLAELVAAVLEVLSPGGHLLLSTNYRQVSQNWLIGQVEEAAGDRNFRVAARCRLPVDFAADRDYQKSILVRFG